jgi:hypothetical protein
MGSIPIGGVYLLRGQGVSEQLNSEYGRLLVARSDCKHKLGIWAIWVEKYGYSPDV